MPSPPLVSRETFVPQTSFASPPQGIMLGGVNLNELAGGLADVANRVAANFAPDPRVRAARQEGIQQQTAQQQQLLQSQIQASVQRFSTIAQTLQAIGQQTGGKIPPSITRILDNETKMLGMWLGQAGMDPQQATQYREAALAQAQIPGQGPAPTEFERNLGTLQDLGVDVTKDQALKAAGFYIPPEQGALAQKVAETEARIGRPLTETEILQAGGFLQNQSTGFILTMDPSTGQVSLQPGGGGGAGAAGGGGGASGTPRGIPIGTPPAALVQETGERLGFLDQAITDIDTLVGIGQQPGSQFGTVGTIKKDLREIVRIAKEGTAGEIGAALSGPIQKLGQTAEAMIGSEVREGLMDPAIAADLLSGDSLTSAADLEKRLAYFYARTLQPDGRLLADTIETAKEQTRIFTLFKSEQTAIEQLLSLRQGLKAARDNLSSAAPGFQGSQPAGAAPTTGAVPEGLPPGSSDTGQKSKNGFPVWRAPNGDLYEVQ